MSLHECFNVIGIVPHSTSKFYVGNAFAEVPVISEGREFQSGYFADFIFGEILFHCPFPFGNFFDSLTDYGKGRISRALILWGRRLVWQLLVIPHLVTVRCNLQMHAYQP